MVLVPVHHFLASTKFVADVVSRVCDVRFSSILISTVAETILYFIVLYAVDYFLF